MRIAVLLVDFPAQAYLRDLLAAWGRAGHDVVLARSVHRHQADTAQMRGSGFDVIDLDATGWRPRALAFCDRLLRRLGLARINLSLREVARRCSRMPAIACCELIVGVEKGGVIVAAELGNRLGVPYAYYSLELYVEGHPGLPRFAHLRQLERAAHAGAVATLVQDARRGAILAEANGVSPDGHVFLPVGSGALRVATVPPPEAGSFVVLYVGVLGATRRLDELAEASSRLGADEVLRVHGPSGGCALPDEGTGKLQVTTGLLDESCLEQLVADAQVGVALYANEPANDRLTAFSSHKLALYLKYGKPVVVPRNESYADLLGLFQCGEMIDGADDLAKVIATIRRDYARYSAEALRAFEAIYDIDRNAPIALDAIVRRMRAATVRASETGYDHGG